MGRVSNGVASWGLQDWKDAFVLAVLVLAAVNLLVSVLIGTLVLCGCIL